MTVAIQMVTSGVVLLTVSSALREWQDGFALADVSLRSALALAYLAVVGSLVALCAYVWLLRRVSAPAVATYAFVNPVVAVFLGWVLAGESFGPRIAVASMLIVSAVVLIQSSLWRPAGQRSVAAPCQLPVATRLARLPALRPAAARSATIAATFEGSGSFGDAVPPPRRTELGSAPSRGLTVALAEDADSRCRGEAS
jgi:hypothetical protein